jgi:hypothetical protein
MKIFEILSCDLFREQAGLNRMDCIKARVQSADTYKTYNCYIYTRTSLPPNDGLLASPKHGDV